MTAVTRPDIADLRAVFESLAIEGAFLDAMPYGTGHINDTYAVRVRISSGVHRYIFQRINTRIFRDPVRLMENIGRVTEHLRRKITSEGGDPERETLTLVPTRSGANVHVDAAGGYWRAYLFIESARTYDAVERPEHVYQAGRAFGRFLCRLADLSGPRLHETIPNFHNTVKRFADFREALRADAVGRADQAQPEIRFALDHERDVLTYAELAASGQLPDRITHNDTKFNNVMIDDRTGEGICVIDLDTVMPGFAPADFGDAVRLAASTAAEDERDLSKVHFDHSRYELLERGFLLESRAFLTEAELKHLPFFARLITYEIGLRFLTDFLAGDVYFKVHRPNHNLDRVRTQFRMVSEMEVVLVGAEES